MNAFNCAVKMEQDGEKFYRDLSAKAADRGVRSILEGLADDEVKHARVLRELEAGSSPDMKATQALSAAKSVFADMAVRKAFAAAGTDQQALYEAALQAERESRDYYYSQAGEAATPAARAVFLKLADEESRHMFLLENMIDFISQPKTWLENAEFNHLEDF